MFLGFGCSLLIKFQFGKEKFNFANNLLQRESPTLGILANWYILVITYKKKSKGILDLSNQKKRLTINLLERHQWLHPGILMLTLEIWEQIYRNIQYINLVLLFITLSKNFSVKQW